MKKAILYIGTFALPLLTFNSCEKENEITEPSSYENANLKHIVSATSYGGPYSFKYDNEGRMTYAKWGDASTTSMILKLKYTDKEINGTRSFEGTQDAAFDNAAVIVGTLNSNGYVSSIKTKSQGSPDIQYNYLYDANNHRVSCQSSQDGSPTSKMTWSWKNGNLATIKEEGSSTVVTFAYVNDMIKEPIENKGKLLFHTVDNEIDEMVNPIYGTAPKELPVSATTIDGDHTVTSTYDWTLDKDGYPTKLQFSTSYGAKQTYTFVWQ